MTDDFSQGQVLDELEFLARVEHTLIVEYLSICYALGHDLEPDQGGATTDQGRNAASTASSLALGQMFHLKNANLALVDSGRSAQLARAASIPGPSSAEIPLGPLTEPQLRQLLERGESIASAVDERYRRLPLSDPLQQVIEDGQTHLAAFTAMRDSLEDLPAADALRATRREPKDAFEQRLMNVSDRSYSLIMMTLEQTFLRQGSFRRIATSAMDSLDEINRALVQHGLLPPFTDL